MIATATDFADRLRFRLDQAGNAGRTLSFWWRDDDAVAPTPQLDRLLALAQSHSVPLTLAVIPATAERSLADRLEPSGDVLVLQHGWAHTNHAPAGSKSAELGDDRPIDDVLDELSRGHQRMSRMFGSRFLPVLVPPWNRISDEAAAKRVETGLPGLSCFKRLGTADRRLDTHVDPIAWRRDRRFVGWSEAAEALDAEIDRRADDTTPIGVLTHHLVHDDATWAFVETLLDVAAVHPAARWPHPVEAFGFVHT